IQDAVVFYFFTLCVNHFPTACKQASHEVVCQLGKPPIGCLNDGTALIHPLSSGAPLRALFQPELHQFQTAFEEAVAEAVDAVGSGVAVVVVVYAGEVLHSTGEWLLADSTFSGEQLHMWLDSNAAATNCIIVDEFICVVQSRQVGVVKHSSDGGCAENRRKQLVKFDINKPIALSADKQRTHGAAWQPEIQKLTTAPSGTEPINIVVCTPSAGAKTRWPMPTTPGGSTQLVMLSKSRRLPVRLQTAASWRANGKLLAAPSNATAFEALHALSDELARLHWEHQSKLLMEVEQEFTLAQRSFRDAPPALYLLPSGHGGVQTQACGLFVVQGVNVLLGSAFADNKPPQWWQLVRSLDRLDTAVFPDWSAASIQSYRFLTKHLLHATSGTYSANWLGCLFTPAPIEPGVESPLLLTPPTTATVTVDPHRLRHLSAQSEQTRLFYKIGVGELSLRYLGSSVGVLLVWHSAAGGGKVRSAVPLTIFLPVVHSLEASVLPASLLAGLVRMLRKVPEITGEGNNVTITATPIKRTTMASTGAKPPGAASKTVNSTTPIQTHVKDCVTFKSKIVVWIASHILLSSGTLRNATPASAKPLASKSAPTRTPTSRVPATRTAAPSRTVPSTPPKPKTTTTTPRPIASATHHTTTTTTTPRDRAPHPTTTRSSTAGAKTTTALAKKSPAEKRPTPASKTEAKLAEHAAKVAKATAEKPGHEIKYAPAGRPSNLPPRRKVGEKTVMEELNELPEVMKTPATDSLAEIVKQQHLSRETEEEVSYPDSLHAEETETKEATMTAAEAEPSKYAVGVEHHEVPAFHEDFAMPAITENHGLATPEVDYSKSPVGVGPGAVQHQEGPKGSSEFPIESLPAKLPAGAVNDEELEMKVSTSPVDRTLVIGSEADEHHEEFVTSKSLATETTLKSPTGMKFEMSPSTDEHHDEFHAHEVESKSPFHEETSEPPADMESAILNAGVEHHEDFEEPRVTELESKSPYHEEISKSSAVIEFSMLPGVPGHHEDFEILKPPVDDGVPTTPTATDYFTKPNDAKHNEELGVSNLECRLREEISKSSAAMEFTTPAGTMSIPPDDEECEIPHETGHQENLQKLGSPSHEEVLRSPT
ncbi:Microtubule-associated protein 1S, partial [Taenia solium]